MIEVAAAVVLCQGKVLLAKKAPGKSLAGYWEFPGGKIEIGETPEECLKRELKEELNIVVTVESYLTEHTHDYGSFVVHLKCFVCALVSGRIKLTDHDEIVWTERENLMSYKLAPADVPLAEFFMSTR